MKKKTKKWKKAPIRIELMNEGFADLSLTTWVRRRTLPSIPKNTKFGKGL